MTCFYNDWSFCLLVDLFFMFFTIFRRENTFFSETSIFIEESYTFLLHIDIKQQLIVFV